MLCFQYDSALYAPSLRLLKEYMRPTAQLVPLLSRIHQQLLSEYCHRALVVGVHIRRGDYSSDVGAAFRSIPVQWYIDWVMDIKQHPERLLRPARQQQDAACGATTEQQQSAGSGDEVVILLISDEPVQVAAEFAAHNLTVITSQQLMRQSLGPFLALAPLVSSWYYDWWLFGQLHVTATSHSSFSYTATMFNSLLTDHLLSQPSESASAQRVTARPYFFCPNSTTLSLTEFDPWHVAYYHLQFWRVDFTRNGTVMQ